MKLDAVASHPQDQAEASAAAATAAAAAATAGSTNDTVSNHAADGDENDRIQSNDDAKITKADDVSPPNAPSSPPASVSPTSQPRAPSSKALPRFFFPGEGGRGRGRALPHDTLEKRSAEIESHFKEYPDGMSHENFVAMTKDLCNLPSFSSTPLHQRVRLLWLEKLKKEGDVGNDSKSSKEKSQKSEGMEDSQRAALMGEDGLVTEDMFRYFWALEMAPYDRWDRFFRLIKRPERRFIYPSDFDPFLRASEVPPRPRVLRVCARVPGQVHAHGHGPNILLLGHVAAMAPLITRCAPIEPKSARCF